MSAPDTAPGPNSEIPAPPQAPTDPAPIDPAAYAGPRRGFGLAFWLLLIGGLACVIAGYLVARMGPTWFPPQKPAAPAAEPAPAAAISSVDARLADIQARLALPPEQEAAREQIVVASAEVAAMGDRLDRMERRQQSALDAAAAALAVASLDQAAQGSGSFSAQLAAVERFLPASTDARRLRILADGGATSRAALAAEYPQMAERVVAAAQAGATGDGLASRIRRAIAAVITVRRIDQATGDGVDAVLARAETKVNDGDIESALAELRALPPGVRAAAEPWTLRAARRLEVDRRLGAIRTSALQRLAQGEENLAGEPPSLDPGL